MTAALLAGLLAGYGIAVPVGAVGAHLVSLTARTGLRTGVCAALGVATADGLYALAATAGGSALASALRPVLGPMRWVCVLMLTGLAVSGAVGAVRRCRGRLSGAGDASPGAAGAFLSLLGITLLNPMTVVYFAALVLGSGGVAAGGWAEGAVFVGAAFAASAGWQVLLAGGGALLGRALTGSRGRLVTGLVAAVVMLVLAVRMALTPSERPGGPCPAGRLWTGRSATGTGAGGGGAEAGCRRPASPGTGAGRSGGGGGHPCRPGGTTARSCADAVRRRDAACLRPRGWFTARVPPARGRARGSAAGCRLRVDVLVVQGGGSRRGWGA